MNRSSLLSKLAIVGLSALFLVGQVSAASINLYQDPKADAAVVGQIDPANGIMPIFTPKGSDWVKVADPSNGNVGWIQQKDLNLPSGTSMSIQQKTIDKNGQENNLYMQMGKPVNPNSPEYKSQLQEMQKFQNNMQKNMKIQIQEFVHGLDNLYQQQMKYLQQNGLYTPAPGAANPANAAPASATPTP